MRFFKAIFQGLTRLLGISKPKPKGKRVCLSMILEQQHEEEKASEKELSHSTTANQT